MCLDITHPWTVYGPTKAHLDRDEVIACIHSNDEHFRKLLREGLFPPGIRETAKGKLYWSALDVACYCYLRTRGMLARLGAAADDEPADE